MPRRFRPRLSRALAVNGVIALALALVLALTVRTVTADDAAPASGATTSTVDVGGVSSTVTASGNVASASTVNVSFEGSGGIVRTIFVEEGEKVRKGQRLALVDRTSARLGLDAALASLASAQAGLATATQGQSAQERAQDQQTINVSAESLDSAEVSLRSARSTYALDRRQHRAEVGRAERALSSAQDDLERAQQQYDADPNATNQQAVQTARSEVSTARSSLVVARTSRQSVLLADRHNIAGAAAQVSSVRAQLRATRAQVAVNGQPARTGQVNSALAQVQSARVTVAEARTTLRQTVLRAPSSGTVTSISGVVGQSSSSSSSSSDSSSSTTTSSASSTTTTSGFITMTAMGVLEVTADVAEADINDVEVGQPATVTLSANDRELSGVVTSVDTIETVTNNVVEYGVTVRLVDPRHVKLGQTSQVVITTGSEQDVLRASSSALTTIGNQTTATVKNDDGSTRTVTVTTGLEGDSETEILGGLSEGDVLVLPQQDTGTTGFTFPGAGVGGGLGGTP